MKNSMNLLSADFVMRRFKVYMKNAVIEQLLEVIETNTST